MILHSTVARMLFGFYYIKGDLGWMVSADQLQLLDQIFRIDSFCVFDFQDNVDDGKQWHVPGSCLVSSFARPVRLLVLFWAPSAQCRMQCFLELTVAVDLSSLKGFLLLCFSIQYYLMCKTVARVSVVPSGV